MMPPALKEDFMQRPARAPSQLSESLHQRLNSYALAASAAGVGVLALALPAEARIVYTPAHIRISPNTEVSVDFNHDGVPDLNIRNSFGSTTFGRAAVSAKGIVAANHSHSAYALYRGALIGPKQPFVDSPSVIMAIYGSGSTKGLWANVTGRYLGVRFQINGKIHYGWARLNVRVGYEIFARLTGYAYETVPNKPIIAGRTQGKDEAEYDSGTGASLTAPIPDKPRPASLGALALGSPGLSIWRREESAGATQ